MIYINDISYTDSEINIDLFADDSTMYESGFKLCTIQDKLQRNINCIVEWCNINNMALNPTKTTCMLLGSSYKLKSSGSLHLTIDNQTIRNVTTQKILGVYVDNMINWRDQINYVCKDLNKKIALLKHITYYLTDDMKLMYYNAYILPIMDYCCVVWGQKNNHCRNRILTIQNRIARIILNRPN